MKKLHTALLLGVVGLLVSVTDGALPGGRFGASVWSVPGSSIYLYGGTGIGAQSGQQGRLNDMWSYDYISHSWRFLSGSQETDVTPLFGDIGTSSATNTPGGIQFACPFYTNDALWLFGGSTRDGSYMSAMWQYVLASNQWMWISGPQNPNTVGTYTNFRSYSATAFPGGREAAVCYSDTANNAFGMFGGRGIGETDGVAGYLNDLWSYSPDSGQWGWMSGDSTVDVVSTPGPKGDPSTTIYPSGTAYVGSWLYTAVGATYSYVGFGTVKTKNQFSDELWRFKAETFEWTLMRGNEDWTKAISNRTGAAVWGSLTEGHSWIFGGYGYDSQNGAGYLGDLHFYAEDTNDYSIFGDSQAYERNGVYGIKGVSSSANYPGSRAYAATWVDPGGNLWMFGGQGFDSVNRAVGVLNDVWKFDMTSKQWTWIGGSQFINIAGDYDPKSTEPGAQLPPDAPAAQSPTTNSQNPTAEPESSPIFNATPQTGQVGEAPKAPQAAGELTADQQIGIGVGIGVGGPVVAGAIILAVLLQKRKASKEGNAKKTPDVEANNSPANPDTGNYNVIPSATATASNTNYGHINAVALDPIVPTADSKVGGADNRLIPYTSVTLEKEIGVGSYGKVYLGKLRTTKVAVKVANTKISQEEFIREANFQLAIPPHPNIVQLLGISIDGPEPLVVLEYCNEGSLDKLLFETEKNWTVAEQINLAAAIARGLDHLHQNNIVHRDLAVRNILLHHGEPKISDFGMSRKLKETAQVGKTATNIGPIRWMAPEALGKQSYSTKSDVWTFGILLYEIVARQEPHADEDLINVAVKIRDAGYAPSIPEGCPELLREIMQMCWKADPAERPEMSLICEKLDIK